MDAANLPKITELLEQADRLGLLIVGDVTGEIAIYTGVTYDPDKASGTFKDIVPLDTE